MSIKNLPITPSNTDPVGALDDQIRMLKTQIKQAFPNISGEITATPAQINALPSTIASFDSDLDQLIADISSAISGVTNASNLIKSKTRKEFNALAKLPRGVIFPFTGDPLSIGSKYQVANGRHGTPDLDATNTPFTTFIMYKGA